MISPNQAASQAVEIGSNPVIKASNFYSLYYMSEVKDIDQTKPDLSFLASQLSDNMFWYGIYGVGRELGGTGAFNLPNSSKIDAETSSKIPLFDFIEAGGDIEQVIDAIDNRHNLSDGAKRIVRNMNEFLVGISGFPDFPPSSVTQVLKNIQKVDALDNPYDFLDHAEEVFNLPYWESGMGGDYGGEQWASVARFISQKPDLSDIIFCDMSFSIEHNSSNWLNKVEPSTEEKTLLDNFTDEADPFYRSVQQPILRDLLDKAQDGEMEDVIDIAVMTGQYKSIQQGRRLI